METTACRRLLSFLASTLLLVSALALVLAFILPSRKRWRIASSSLVAAAAVALLFGNLRDIRRG